NRSIQRSSRAFWHPSKGRGMQVVTIQGVQGAVYNLGPVSGIPLGEGRAFQVGSLTVAVFRTRTGELFATQATCPHKAGPLADGIVGGGRVICPLHAYTFDLATGQSAVDTCDALAVYPVATSASGDILLSLEHNH